MATCLALALAAVACTAPASDEPETSPPPVTSPDLGGPAGDRGGTLRVGLSLDPVSIDPRFVTDAEGELVVGALFEPLVTLDERHEPVPGAARRWEMHEEGRRFVFHLRGATFHDGSPVTADDFVRSFTRLLDGTATPPSYLGYLLDDVAGADRVAEAGGAVDGLRAIDEQTLEITLRAPRPAFVTTLADPSLVPVPADADEDLEAFAARPVGNGPFAMTEAREPGAFLRLTRFADHHRPPVLDEVVFTVFPDSGARDQQWDDLLAGQLHIAEVPPERLDEARERFGESPDGYRGPGVLDGVAATVYLYAFDVAQPPFDDVRVRQALSLAIDRERLADRVLAGSRDPAYGIVPPPVPGSQRWACAYCRHDPGLARELWDEVLADRRAADAAAEDAASAEDAESAEDAGSAEDAESAEEPPTEAPADEEVAEEPIEVPVPDDLARITLTHNRGRTHAAIAERMAADIESALDVTVDVAAFDLGPFLQRVHAGDIPLFRVGWETNVPDPGAYLVPMFASSGLGRDNLSGFTDEGVDVLLEEARTRTRPAAARSRYREAERRILDAMPVMPLLWYRDLRVVAPDVEGLRWSPFGRIDLASVSLRTP